MSTILQDLQLAYVDKKDLITGEESESRRCADRYGFHQVYTAMDFHLCVKYSK